MITSNADVVWGGGGQPAVEAFSTINNDHHPLPLSATPPYWLIYEVPYRPERVDLHDESLFKAGKCLIEC